MAMASSTSPSFAPDVVLFTGIAMSGKPMPALDRRTLLTGAAALLAHSGARAAPASDWQPVALAEAGFLPELDVKLDQFVIRRAANIHSVVIARRGRLVLE